MPYSSSNEFPLLSLIKQSTMREFNEAVWQPQPRWRVRYVVPYLFSKILNLFHEVGLHAQATSVNFHTLATWNLRKSMEKYLSRTMLLVWAIMALSSIVRHDFRCVVKHKTEVSRVCERVVTKLWGSVCVLKSLSTKRSFLSEDLPVYLCEELYAIIKIMKR